MADEDTMTELSNKITELENTIRKLKDDKSITVSRFNQEKVSDIIAYFSS